MNHSSSTATRRLSMLALAASLTIGSTSISLAVEIEIIAIGSMPGTGFDASGLAGELDDGTPLDRLGGFSAIEYSRQNDLYFVLPDRGPMDGAVAYPCRLHSMRIRIVEQTRRLDAEIVATMMLTDQSDRQFFGSLSSLGEKRFDRGRNLDPEGLRLDSDGGYYVSDEYGPSILRFSPAGALFYEFKLPKTFALCRQSNLAEAKNGAIPNRGLEGLAISPDKSTLWAVLQGPLVQDSFSEDNKRFGRWARILQLDLVSNRLIGSFLYPLDDYSTGLSEILAIDNNRFLVIERDGEARSTAKVKRIYRVDVSQATKIQTETNVPPKKLPRDCKPAAKQLLIDLLDSRWQIPPRYSLEKPEGLAWGPASTAGEDTLIVCFDNDFQSDADSLIVAFRVPND